MNDFLANFNIFLDFYKEPFRLATQLCVKLMQVIRSKTSFSILVLALLVGPQACLVEQALAQITQAFPHGHDEEETHDHHSTAPSHKHDEEGHENQFCCDNDLNLYILGNSSVQFDPDWLFVHPPKEAVNFEAILLSVSPRLNLHHVRPLTPRGRDRYALNCLLHAPPSA